MSPMDPHFGKTDGSFPGATKHESQILQCLPLMSFLENLFDLRRYRFLIKQKDTKNVTDQSFCTPEFLSANIKGAFACMITNLGIMLENPDHESVFAPFHWCCKALNEVHDSAKEHPITILLPDSDDSTAVLSSLYNGSNEERYKAMINQLEDFSGWFSETYNKWLEDPRIFIGWISDMSLNEKQFWLTDEQLFAFYPVIDEILRLFSALTEEDIFSLFFMNFSNSTFPQACEEN